MSFIHHTRPQRLARSEVGVSLLEALIALALGTLIASASAGSLLQWMQQWRLQHASQQLGVDLRSLRETAVWQGQPLRFSTQTLPNGSCYLIHSGPIGACTCVIENGQTRTSCNAEGRAMRAAGWPQQSGFSLSGNVRTLSVDPMQGTVTPAGTLTLQGPSGSSVSHVVSMMGRVRSCVASGQLFGQSKC